MLDHSFIQINGIGAKTEQWLWANGVHSPAELIEPYPTGLPPAKVRLIRQYRQTTPALPATAAACGAMFSAAQHWRLFPQFRARTVYLDIETDGGREDGMVTTIALYDGRTITTFVNGINLEEFADFIGAYEVIVTYNGKCFDIPVLAERLGIRFDQLIIDLRFLLSNLGYRGGLKGCERQLGIERGELAGVDGYGAVLLWQEYERSGERRLLETLLAYNVLDAVNLEALMVEAFNRNLLQTPFFERYGLATPPMPVNPFRADAEVVARLRRALAGYR